MSTTRASQDESLNTIAEIADRAGVSAKTVRRWIERGELPAYGLGRQLRVAESDWRTFLKMRRLG